MTLAHTCLQVVWTLRLEGDHHHHHHLSSQQHYRTPTPSGVPGRSGGQWPPQPLHHARSPGVLPRCTHRRDTVAVPKRCRMRWSYDSFLRGDWGGVWGWGVVGGGWWVGGGGGWGLGAECPRMTHCTPSLCSNGGNPCPSTGVTTTRLCLDTRARPGCLVPMGGEATAVMGLSVAPRPHTTGVAAVALPAAVVGA
jgi:hypothetical protein